MNSFQLHSLELIDYIRLKPNGIFRLLITLDNIFQIIIGTNGSGKSSLMRELNPLPGNPKDYGKKGKKIICFRFGTRYFKLINDFKEGHHYFYLTDDHYEPIEDMNPSGNVSTQRKLCLEYFGLDQDIMNVLMGVKGYRFTEMSKIRRKEWMLRLGNDDLDFAMKLHKSIRSEMLSKLGVIKHLKRRIGDESVKSISEEEITELRRKSNVLVEQLNTLMVAIIPGTANADMLKADIRSNISALNRMMDGVLKKRSIDRVDLGLRIDADDPSAYLHQLRSYAHSTSEQISANEKRIDKLYTESNRISQYIQTLADNAAKSTNDLREEVKRKCEALDTLKRTLVIDDSLEYIESRFNTVGDFKEKFESLISELIENPDNHLNLTKYKENDVLISEKTQLLRSLNTQLVQLEHQLEHMTNTQLTECPKCSHKWFPLVGATIDEVRSSIKIKNDLINETNDIIDKCTAYNQLYLNRRSVMTDINGLKISQHGIFIEYLLKNEYWEKSNSWLLMQCQYWYRDTISNYEIYKLTTQIDSLNAAIAASSAFGGDNEVTSERLVEIDAEINELLEEVHILKSRRDLINIHMSELDEMIQIHRKGIDLVRTVSNQLHALVEAEINSYIDSDIANVQSQLANIQNALNSAESVESILRSLEADLAKVEEESKAITVLEAELSPTSGLIAEHINDFINIFVDQLNSVISQVWSQSLNVLPCGFEREGELDYNFPIKSGSLISNDVSLGSSAQQDMIDFAFVQVVYLYLGLEHYPLWIDELAPTMDDLHRVRIVQYVKSLMDNNRHSQMFMISHYISGHGVFSNADFCVMSEANILHKPKVYNKHVIME